MNDGIKLEILHGEKYYIFVIGRAVWVVPSSQKQSSLDINEYIKNVEAAVEASTNWLRFAHDY